MEGLGNQMVKILFTHQAQILHPTNMGQWKRNDAETCI
jgi:hypothetical protein